MKAPPAQVAGEKQAVRPIRPERGQEPQLRNAHVLRFIDDDELEKRLPAARQLRRQPTEHSRAGDKTFGVQSAAHDVEHRPERNTLRFRQARLAAQALHVPIRFPAVQLPGIDQVLPFRLKEPRAEFLDAGRRCRLRQ